MRKSSAFYCKNIFMKYFIITLYVITAINPLVHSHENHDHKIYSWSNSKNNTSGTENISNGENLEDKKNKTINDTKNNWIEIFKR